MNQTTDLDATVTPAAPPSKRWRFWTVLAMAAAILVWGRSGGTEETTEVAKAASSTGALACAHARNVVSDLEAGVLPKTDFARKLAEIHSATTDLALRVHATVMLDAYAARAVESFELSATAFFDRCQALGR